jgi:hypothetical protein
VRSGEYSPADANDFSVSYLIANPIGEARAICSSSSETSPTASPSTYDVVISKRDSATGYEYETRPHPLHQLGTQGMEDAHSEPKLLHEFGRRDSGFAGGARMLDAVREAKQKKKHICADCEERSDV